MAHLTGHELATLAVLVAIGNTDIDTALASLDEDDEFARTNLLPIVQYETETRRRRSERAKIGPAQKRGYRLLRSLLTPEQRAALNRSCPKGVVIELPSGNAYRLHPNTGAVHLVEKHGQRWFMRGMFCYHEESSPLDKSTRLPPADRSVGILLMLLADEGRFLAEANFTASDMWRPGYRAMLAESYQQYEIDARAELANEGIDADLFYRELNARRPVEDENGQLLATVRLRSWWTEEQITEYVQTGRRPPERIDTLPVVVLEAAS